MSDIEVRVEGRKKRKSRRGIPGAGLVRGFWCVLRFFLVRPRLLILIGFLGFIGHVGTPHIGWDYQCRHATPGGAPCRSASWCEYYGFQGRRVDHPPQGETCKLVKFLPVDWELLGEDLSAWAARQWEKVQ